VCEQRAQGCYPTARLPGIELATIESQVQRALLLDRHTTDDRSVALCPTVRGGHNETDCRVNDGSGG